MKPGSKPLISVILPVYNCAAFLHEAMESIHAQNYEELEIVVVDDGSTDATPEVARALDPRVRYIRQENQGPAVARNTGILAASSSILAMIDGDDRWPENKLAIQLPLLVDNPEIELVAGLTQRMTLQGMASNGRRIYAPWEKAAILPNVGAHLFRKSAFDRIGLFDPALRLGEDTDWMLRFREAKGPTIQHNDVALYYCLHLTNSVRGKDAIKLNLPLLLKRSLARRRASGEGQAAEMAAWKRSAGGANATPTPARTPAPPTDPSAAPSPVSSAAPSAAPQVSVVIAVFNGERFIAQAIESILAQRHDSLELVVVDDGSTDRTAEIVRTFPQAILIQQANAGQSSAMNRGIAAARGEFLAFVDADDLWVPGKLKLQFDTFAKEPDLEGVYGHAEQFFEADAPPSVVAAYENQPRILPAHLHGSLLVRRSGFERVGPFDETVGLAGAFDWFARARGMGFRWKMLDEVVMRRRIHSDNIGRRARNDRTHYAVALKAALDRRRAAARTDLSGPSEPVDPSNASKAR